MLVIILLLTTKAVYSQDCNNIGFEKQLVKKIVNQQFGNLISQDSKTNIGNFASLDLKKAEVNFNGNVFFNNGSVLGIKAKGAVTTGYFLFC